MTINEDGMVWSRDPVSKFLYGSSCSGYFNNGYEDIFFLIGGYKNCTTDEETFNGIRYFIFPGLKHYNLKL